MKMRGGLTVHIIAGVLLAISIISTALSESAPFVSGRIIWSSGVPAQGLEVLLLRDGGTASTAFTDATGYFAFYGVPGHPNEYRINIMTAGGTVAEASLFNTPLGGTIPLITLK